MIKIRWQDKFSVDNKKIDNEHKTFIELIRSLSEAIEQERDLLHIERLLTELGLYARFHFYSEETLMHEHDYPGLADHKAEHEALLDKFEKRAAEFRQDPSAGGTDLILFLFTWFADHTAGTDHDLARFLD